MSVLCDSRPIYGDHKSPHPQCPHVSDNINDGTLHNSQQAQVLQVIVIITCVARNLIAISHIFREKDPGLHSLFMMFPSANTEMKFQKSLGTAPVDKKIIFTRLQRLGLEVVD